MIEAQIIYKSKKVSVILPVYIYLKELRDNCNQNEEMGQVLGPCSHQAASTSDAM
jgi:hypothetical protein